MTNENDMQEAVHLMDTIFKAAREGDTETLKHAFNGMSATTISGLVPLAIESALEGDHQEAVSYLRTLKKASDFIEEGQIKAEAILRAIGARPRM